MKGIVGSGGARRLRFGLWTALAILAFVTVASADPPGRVGRLNFMEGSVSFRAAGIEDWSSARLNYPVTVGDRVWTDSGSRAELHIGSTAVRLGPQTDFDVLNLSDDTTQLSLSQGSIIVHINRLDEDDVFEIDTPNAAVSLLRAGFYRIDVSGDGDASYITVRRGQADVTAEGNEFSIDPNQTAIISGTNLVSYDIEPARSIDRWDDWCLARDRREAQRAADIARDRYVSADMTGYEDLYGYGTWRAVPDYGTVWVPTSVAAGWAPYRYGHWAWVYPWGWTWVDDAPWGFAPFHYGRWAYIGGGWAWVPGTYVARPVYAPALVAFVGGGGWSLSFGGGGGVAWFPLGPREVYVPAYRTSPTYVRNVNVTNVNVTNINVTNINVQNVNYVNRRVAGAVTAVPQTAFVGGKHVANAAVQVRQSEIATATVTGTTATVTPTRASVLTAETAGAAVSLPPQKALKRGIVAKSAVPPEPVAFSAQVQAMKDKSGAPPDPESLKAYRKQQRLEERSVKQATVPTGSLKPAREGITVARPITVDATSPGGKKHKADTDAQQNTATTPVDTNEPGRKNKNKQVTDSGQVTTGNSASQPDTGPKHKNRQIDAGQPTGNTTTQTGQPDSGPKHKNKQTDAGQPTGNTTTQTGQPDSGPKQKNKHLTDQGQPSGNPSGQGGQTDTPHKNKNAAGSTQPSGNAGQPAGGGQPGGKVKQKEKVDDTNQNKNKKAKEKDNNIQ